ncbi:hypothetical protein ES702_05645 [subsurface metagenome]
MDIRCYVCMLRQIIEMLEYTDFDNNKKHKIFMKVYQYLREQPQTANQVKTGNNAYMLMKRETGIEDICKSIKEVSNKKALEIYSWLRRLVKRSDDKLKTAIKIATAGNVIDIGPGFDLNLRKTVKKVLKQNFEIDHLEEFRKSVSRAASILYLADNAGETVFDRILIEELEVPVIYAVKQKPVGNDALYQYVLSA